MDDPLKLNSYVVQRQFKFGGLSILFMDSNGQQVLKSEGKALVTQQPLQTMDGKVISTVTHKIISASPEYDIHKGDAKGEVTAIVKEPMQIISTASLNIEIKDPSGKVIATASGNFMDMAVEIRDSAGNSLATISRKLDASGVLGKLAQFTSNSYRMDVTGNSVPTQTLLEFLIVFELLLSTNRGSNPGVVRGFGLGGIGGMGGPGGFGGGPGGIQF